MNPSPMRPRAHASPTRSRAPGLRFNSDTVDFAPSPMQSRGGLEPGRGMPELGRGLSPLAQSSPHRPPPSRANKTLAELRVASPTLAELDRQSDPIYRQKLASTAREPLGQVPGGEWAVQQAEERLADADRRVRLIQAEAEVLESLRKQQVVAGEEAVLKLKRKLLDDWEDREREWERKREDELRAVKAREMKLAEQEQRLHALEERQEAALQQQEEDIRRRSLQAEDDRNAMVRQIEERLRRELVPEMEPQIRREVEEELTHRITNEVRAELQREFARMCEAMKHEVERVRQRMEVEIERELEPKVEERIAPEIKRRVEEELHDTVLRQLHEATQATQLLKDELRNALNDRDRCREQVVGLQNEVRALEEELQRAEQRRRAEAQRWEQERAGTQSELRAERDDCARASDQLRVLGDEYRQLVEQHRVLQNAAAGVVQHHTKSHPTMSPSRKGVRAVPPPSRSQGAPDGRQASIPSQQGSAAHSLMEFARRGSRQSPPPAPYGGGWQQPQLLPSGAVSC